MVGRGVASFPNPLALESGFPSEAENLSNLFPFSFLEIYIDIWSCQPRLQVMFVTYLANSEMAPCLFCKL